MDRESRAMTAANRLPTLPNEVIGRKILDFIAPSAPPDRWPWLFGMSLVFPNEDLREIIERFVPSELHLYKIARVSRPYDGLTLLQWVVFVPWITSKIQTIKATSPFFGMFSVVAGDYPEDIWSLVFSASTLENFVNVRSVKVPDNELCSEGFLLMLAQNLPSLNKLTIDGLGRDSTRGTSLIDQLGDFAETPRLQMHSLCLVSCTTPSRALESFLSRQGVNLTELQLRFCRGYDPMVIAEHCSSLEVLSITNHRDNISGVTVCAIVKANPGIVDLDFSFSVLDEDLVGALQNESTQLHLHSFHAKGCDGFNDHTLLQIVQSFPALHTVNARLTDVTIHGLRSALEASRSLGRGVGSISFRVEKQWGDESLPREWQALVEDFPDVAFQVEWKAARIDFLI